MKKIVINSTITFTVILALANFIMIGCTKSGNEKQNNEVVQTLNIEEEITNAKKASGNMQVYFPKDDPGAPFYARSGPLLNQFFISNGWLVIPFFRDLSCIRPDFNFLNVFDVPAAFSCALTVNGFYIIEADAPIGTFPLIVQSTGTAVPFWFVRWDAFSQIAEDGVVTIEDRKALNPLTGTADKFKETLRPRMESHHVQINASGVLEDGRSFNFHVTHVGDETKNIGLTIK
jgi:hypothetical protein